jgi:4-amino-4-deoxy-L-arabinose transferase-like glycosyltransferase
MYIKSNSPLSPFFLPLVLMTVFFFLFLNIGDLDALRQGTEGFYLQIAKEMSQGKDFLTPKYLGNPHWSKPPLHFWMHLPIQFLFPGATTVWSSRVSVAILSLILLFLTSRWIKRNLDIPVGVSFIFLFSTVGVFKYSKIYMMEAPLAFLGLYSALKFYDFIRFEKFNNIWCFYGPVPFSERPNFHGYDWRRNWCFFTLEID